jgi:ABC-type maltose transport system permease subunit
VTNADRTNAAAAATAAATQKLVWMPPSSAAMFNAFGVFLRQFIRGIPMELEEAAAIDGANRFRIFATIILPLLAVVSYVTNGGPPPVSAASLTGPRKGC